MSPLFLLYTFFLSLDLLSFRSRSCNRFTPLCFFSEQLQTQVPLCQKNLMQNTARWRFFWDSNFVFLHLILKKLKANPARLSHQHSTNSCQCFSIKNWWAAKEGRLSVFKVLMPLSDDKNPEDGAIWKPLHILVTKIWIL